jgi:hypothetical protein
MTCAAFCFFGWSGNYRGSDCLGLDKRANEAPVPELSLVLQLEAIGSTPEQAEVQSVREVVPVLNLVFLCGDPNQFRRVSSS